MKNRVMVLVLTAFVLANAFSQTEVDFEVGLTKDMQGVVIKKYTGKQINVRIPATIQGMPVREIEAAFSRHLLHDDGTMTSITSVVIPSGVTVIGAQAFDIQDRLTSVTLPDTITSIGYFAFRATALASITLPDSLTSIGQGAFRECSKLESIAIPDSVTYIGNEAFSKSGLKSIKWPPRVTVINEEMFEDCKNLQSFVLPEGAKNIRADAFRNCSALTSVVIPDSVTSIPDFYYCFQGCSRLSLASQAALRKVGYKGEF